MPVGTLAPSAVLQVFDQNGDPLAAAQLFSYITGTSTPTPLYHDAALTVPWTNPAIADAGGFFVGLYMAASPAQKWVLQNAASVIQWTVDPIVAVNAATSGINNPAFVFGGANSAPVTAATYALGATFDFLSPGTAVLAIDSSNLAGTYVLQVTGLVTGGTMTVGIFDLDSGAPNTPLATCAITSLTGEVADSGSITFGAGGTVRHYGLKALISGGFTGFFWGASLQRTA